MFKHITLSALLNHLGDEELSKIKDQRILIIDDDLEFARSLNKILQKAGYKVSMAPEGVVAGEMLSKEFYPLILLDIHMPGKSGLDVLKEVKKSSPESRVIIVTVNDTLDLYDEAKKSGIFAFLNKPVKRQTILECARQALETTIAETNKI